MGVGCLTSKREGLAKKTPGENSLVLSSVLKNDEKGEEGSRKGLAKPVSPWGSVASPRKGLLVALERRRKAVLMPQDHMGKAVNGRDQVGT